MLVCCLGLFRERMIAGVINCNSPEFLFGKDADKVKNHEIDVLKHIAKEHSDANEEVWAFIRVAAVIMALGVSVIFLALMYSAVT